MYILYICRYVCMYIRTRTRVRICIRMYQLWYFILIMNKKQIWWKKILIVVYILHQRNIINSWIDEFKLNFQLTPCFTINTSAAEHIQKSNVFIIILQIPVAPQKVKMAMERKTRIKRRKDKWGFHQWNTCSMQSYLLKSIVKSIHRCSGQCRETVIYRSCLCVDVSRGTAMYAG